LTYTENSDSRNFSSYFVLSLIRSYPTVEIILFDAVCRLGLF